MKRSLALILIAVLLLCTASACTKENPELGPKPVSQSFSAEESETPTPAPDPLIEPPPPSDEMPLIVDPGPGSFPGGLDDDGPGGEYAVYDEEDPRFEGVTIVENVELTAETQYEANVFLSNFAEQCFWFYCYDLDMGQFIDRIVDFAHIWYKINDYSAITYGQLDGHTYEILSADRFCEIAERYFPFEMTEDTIETYFRPQEHSFYQDGRFFFDAADGEAYNRIAVADGITRLSDGSCVITFTEYDIDLNTYYSFTGDIPLEYYELTPASAAERRDLTMTASGSAIVLPYDYNGRSTYQLIEYTVW